MPPMCFHYYVAVDTSLGQSIVDFTNPSHVLVEAFGITCVDSPLPMHGKYSLHQ